eukprot:2501897-Rhodomonas_salina.1
MLPGAPFLSPGGRALPLGNVIDGVRLKARAGARERNLRCGQTGRWVSCVSCECSHALGCVLEGVSV